MLLDMTLGGVCMYVAGGGGGGGGGQKKWEQNMVVT